MKAKKRIIAALLALATVTAFAPVTAFAGDAATTLDKNTPSGSTNVTYEAAASYTVTIPASVTLSQADEEAAIAFSGVKLPKGQKISVTLSDATNKNLSQTSDFNVAQTDTAVFATYTVTDGASTPKVYALGDEVAAFAYDGTENAGSTKLYFTAPQGASYAGTYTDQLTFTISTGSAAVPVSSVSIPATLSLNVGANQTLTANIEPDDATDKTVTWTSDLPDVATVDNNGKVTAVAAGTATITATTANGKTATCTVTVKVPVSGITLSSSTLYLAPGGVKTLTATISPANAADKTVTWTSDFPDVATVDSNGKVTAGNTPSTYATITATTANGKTATCQVVVDTPDVFYIDGTPIAYYSMNQTWADIAEDNASMTIESNMVYINGKELLQVVDYGEWHETYNVYADLNIDMYASYVLRA